MWLQLGNQEFRQVLMTGIVRRLVVRGPCWTRQPAAGSWEDAYIRCTWRNENHSLLDYLRLCNKDGERRKNRRRVCVAAVTNSRLKDAYYGQWLVLNVPFRNLLELWDERANLVPAVYRMLTLCLLKRPGFFRPSQVKQEMQLEGHRDVHINNVLGMLEGHKAVIDGYLSGAWTVGDNPEPLCRRQSAGKAPVR